MQIRRNGSVGGARQNAGRLCAENGGRMVLGILFVFLILSGVLLYVLYQNSYAGQVKKGNKAALEQNFDEAIAYYQRAIEKNPERPEAYTGLAKIYILESDEQKAEDLFLNAVEKISAEHRVV